MATTREDPAETKARLLYMALRAGGWELTKQQYLTIKGWITAGQLEKAESAMLKHGILVGGEKP